MATNRDFSDLLSDFCAAEVRVTATYGGIAIGLLSLDDLIASKRQAGRAQDLLDLEWLERAKSSR